MWKRLDKWQNNLKIGMTKEKYLNLCEQMGTEPQESKCPPGPEDFPLVLQQAIEVFNRMGDRVVANIGYVGKDYSALSVYMKNIGVTNEDLFLEALARLDEQMIKQSQEQMKRAQEAAKKKGRGK